MKPLKNIDNYNLKKKCYSILDSLKNNLKDQIIQITIDQDLILTFLEISLYPNQIKSEIEYSILSTDLICTRNILEVIINMCFFDSDSSSYTSSISDSTSNSSYNSDFNINDSLNEYETNYKYENNNTLTLPISILIMFITNYSNKEVMQNNRYLAMFNFCKIIYSLILFDLNWTWIYLISINEGYILFKLINLINHSSIIHLLKLIIIIICDCDLKNKSQECYFKLFHLSSKINSNINSYIFIEFLFSNFKLFNEYEYDSEQFDIDQEILILNNTTHFITDILEDKLYKEEIINHFSLKNLIIKDSTSLNNNIQKWLFNQETTIKNWPICSNIITNIISKNNINKLLDNILSSIKILNYNLNNFNYKKLSYYTHIITCSLFILNSILNYELNIKINQKSYSQYKSSGFKKYIKFDFLNNLKLNHSKIINPLKFIIPNNKNYNNYSDTNLKTISNVIIPIIKEYIWKFLLKLYIIDESITNRKLIIPIIIEILNYIKILILNNDIIYIKRLISEINNETNIPIIWEIFDLIIFNTNNYSAIQDSLYELFQLCINCLKEENLSFNNNNVDDNNVHVNNGINNNINNNVDNIELNAKIYFLFKYINSSFIKNIQQYHQEENIRKQEWIDNRILKRKIENKIKNDSNNCFDVIIPYSKDRRFHINLNEKEKISHLAYYLLTELYSLQNDIFWIKDILNKSNIYFSKNTF